MSFEDELPTIAKWSKRLDDFDIDKFLPEEFFQEIKAAIDEFGKYFAKMLPLLTVRMMMGDEESVKKLVKEVLAGMTVFILAAYAEGFRTARGESLIQGDSDAPKD